MQLLSLKQNIAVLKNDLMLINKKGVFIREIRIFHYSFCVIWCNNKCIDIFVTFVNIIIIIIIRLFPLSFNSKN